MRQKTLKKVYLDYAATTPVHPRALKKMLPYFSEKFGNTMSLYELGQEAKTALEESRGTIAKHLKARSEEIIFTGSATESNNLALKGTALANRKKGNHIIISSIEHPCIMESGKWLEGQGFKVTRLPVDRYGLVQPTELEKAIKKETILVSIIHASNEIGTIQPIERLVKRAKRKKKEIYFHTDAVQSFSKLPIDVNKMGIDLLTASSHKIYGPKGAAFLYIKKGVRIEPLLHGGGQEMGLRSSTVNVPVIVGFAEAVKITHKIMKKEGARLSRLRDYLISRVLKEIPCSSLNGHPLKRLPNNINFSFDYVEGESIVIQLDMEGISVSTGSACSSSKLQASHVLRALGLSPEKAHGSLRITLGLWTRKSEIDYLLKVLPGIIENLRRLSPIKK